MVHAFSKVLLFVIKVFICVSNHTSSAISVLVSGGVGGIVGAGACFVIKSPCISYRIFFILTVSGSLICTFVKKSVCKAPIWFA